MIPKNVYKQQQQTVYKMEATEMATVGKPHHHALKYRTYLATPFATAVARAANSDTALVLGRQIVWLFFIGLSHQLCHVLASQGAKHQNGSSTYLSLSS